MAPGVSRSPPRTPAPSSILVERHARCWAAGDRAGYAAGPDRRRADATFATDNFRRASCRSNGRSDHGRRRRHRQDRHAGSRASAQPSVDVLRDQASCRALASIRAARRKWATRPIRASSASEVTSGNEGRRPEGDGDAAGRGSRHQHGPYDQRTWRRLPRLEALEAPACVAATADRIGLMAAARRGATSGTASSWRHLAAISAGCGSEGIEAIAALPGRQRPHAD